MTTYGHRYRDLLSLHPEDAEFLCYGEVRTYGSMIASATQNANDTDGASEHGSEDEKTKWLACFVITLSMMLDEAEPVSSLSPQQ